MAVLAPWLATRKAGAAVVEPSDDAAALAAGTEPMAKEATAADVAVEVAAAGGRALTVSTNADLPSPLSSPLAPGAQRPGALD